MYGLELRNGDLVLDAHDYGVIEGPQRVLHDLSIALREPYGADRFHPQWGSTLDSLVGSLSAGVEDSAHEEVVRVVRNYATLQAQIVREDAEAGRRARLSARETVVGVADSEVTTDRDAVRVRAVLETLDGVPLDLDAQGG